MREVIAIHVGQAGCQIGNSCWELFCKEHGIQPNGIKVGEDRAKKSVVTKGGDNAYNTFFQELSNGRNVPRSIFVDLEPTVIDQIRTGKYSELFHPEQLINGKEDASNNFGRGKYTTGKSLIDQTVDQIRKLTENCTGLQGFIIYNSVGGGTGSGFTTNLCEKLHELYPKKCNLNYCIWPSPRLGTSVVEPYNAVLATHNMIKYTNCTFMMDNEAIYGICKRRLGIQSPTYKHINQLVAQVVSSMTASLRFEGNLNVDLNEFETNLVPFPRNHFMMTSYAPIVTSLKSQQEVMSVQELTTALFDPSNFMIKIDDITKGKYLCCCMMYRGDVPNRDVTNSINNIKKNKNIPFVDWCPCPFKCGINSQENFTVDNSYMASTNRSACMEANHTAISQVFGKINQKFDMMFNKRAFVHWFVGEGMEETEFTEARQDLQELEAEYSTLAIDNAEYDRQMQIENQ